jgi:hypothetical protein
MGIQIYKQHIGLEVLTTVTMKRTIFWGMMSCGIVYAEYLPLAFF